MSNISSHPEFSASSMSAMRPGWPEIVAGLMSWTLSVSAAASSLHSSRLIRSSRVCSLPHCQVLGRRRIFRGICADRQCGRE